MPKWEYLEVNMTYDARDNNYYYNGVDPSGSGKPVQLQNLSNILNYCGQYGWELVSMNATVWATMNNHVTVVTGFTAVFKHLSP